MRMSLSLTPTPSWWAVRVVVREYLVGQGGGRHLELWRGTEHANRRRVPVRLRNADSHKLQKLRSGVQPDVEEAPVTF
jgi:hypothetical protein